MDSHIKHEITTEGDEEREKSGAMYWKPIKEMPRSMKRKGTLVLLGDFRKEEGYESNWWMVGYWYNAGWYTDEGCAYHKNTFTHYMEIKEPEI